MRSIFYGHIHIDKIAIFSYLKKMFSPLPLYIEWLGSDTQAPFKCTSFPIVCFVSLFSRCYVSRLFCVVHVLSQEFNGQFMAIMKHCLKGWGQFGTSELWTFELLCENYALVLQLQYVLNHNCSFIIWKNKI